MNNLEVTIKTKDLRKGAFAVMFGLTVGKAVGDLVSAGINGITTGLIKSMAKHGNKAAQVALKKAGVDDSDDEEDI